MDHGTLYIALACLFGLWMTWGVGANDLANVMSTTMGSKAITVRQAIIIAIVFEFAGAILAGGNVTATIRNGIIDTSALSGEPTTLIYGMIAVLLTGTSWMTLASFLGMPVSITHTIIGSIVGFGLIVVGIHAIHWNMVLPIIMSWITSPVIAGILAYSLFYSVQRFIFVKDKPLQHAKRYVIFYMFLIGVILSADVFLRGLDHFGIHFNHWFSFCIIIILSLLSSLLGWVIVRHIHIPEDAKRRMQLHGVEKVFSVLMLFTACAMVFAHGSNDVANAVGPMAVVITIVKNNGAISQSGLLPVWIVVLGCTGVVIGLLTYGKKVIHTVGTGITALTPSRAFAATLAAALTVVLATSTGIPVSATQTLVGGVLGVGLARGIGALNMPVVRNIFMSWFITLPVGAILTIIYFHLLARLFSL